MKNKFLAPILSIFILVAFSAAALHVNAQNKDTNKPPTGSDTNIGITLKNPLKDSVGNTIPDLLRALINDILLPIGGVIAVIFFILSGFKYVTARGDTKKIQDAHRALLYTAVGTAVLLGAWVIAQVIGNTIRQITI